MIKTETEMFEFTKDHEDVCISNGVVAEAGFSAGASFPVMGKEDLYIIILAGTYKFKIPLTKEKIIKE